MQLADVLTTPPRSRVLGYFSPEPRGSVLPISHAPKSVGVAVCTIDSSLTVACSAAGTVARAMRPASVVTALSTRRGRMDLEQRGRARHLVAHGQVMAAAVFERQQAFGPDVTAADHIVDESHAGRIGVVEDGDGRAQRALDALNALFPPLMTGREVSCATRSALGGVG